MEQQQSPCSCGADGKTLITCSGLSNTGRLTTQVATILMSRHPAAITWVKTHKGGQHIADATEDADLVIILEGCPDHCASKKPLMRESKMIFTWWLQNLGLRKPGWPRFSGTMF